MMMVMNISLEKRFLRILIVTGFLISISLDSTSKELKSSKMTTLPIRLQPMFEKMKTVCFGRFVVDVPATATTAWGRSIVGLTVNVYPDAAEEVEAQAQQFIRELSSEKTGYNLPQLVSVDDVSQPEGQVVTGYTSLTSTVTVRIRGYFRLNKTGVVISALPMSDDRHEAKANILKIARHLRQRHENEVPSEPGNCIEFGFLPDDPSAPEGNPGELLEVGFRLQEFPDTHVSISIRPAKRKFDESNTLEWQLARLERDLKAENPNHIRLKTKYFRRGKRTIQNWGEGFEALSRSPQQPEIHSIHDFGMDFQGVGNDPLRPFINVQMQTGIVDNEAGVAKPLLSDAEAIAVWDKITSTIRVRPTGAVAAKAAEENAQPRLPLGELAATGRTCPQSGIWESSEAAEIEGVQRRYVKVGDTMPRVAVRGEPSLWQKIKGETPSHQLATVWKLVDYDDDPAISGFAAQMPSAAQGLPAAESAKSANSADDSQSKDASPNGRG